MNYLSHLFLARPTAAGYVGALLPDMTRGAEVRRILANRHDYPVDLIEGIELHRLVDRLTDVHPGYLSAKRRLFEDQGRYAGIVADVVFDHVLSRQWQKWAERMPFGRLENDSTLKLFLQEIEAILSQASTVELMPVSMHVVVERMIQGQWLHQYQTAAGLGHIFWMMSQRFSARFARKVELWSAVEVVQREAAGFEEDFEPLFDDLIKAVQQAASC